jgi:hypothetical protein
MITLVSPPPPEYAIKAWRCAWVIATPVLSKRPLQPSQADFPTRAEVEAWKAELQTLRDVAVSVTPIWKRKRRPSASKLLDAADWPVQRANKQPPVPSELF